MRRRVYLRMLIGVLVIVLGIYRYSLAVNCDSYFNLAVRSFCLHERAADQQVGRYIIAGGIAIMGAALLLTVFDKRPANSEVEEKSAAG